MFEENAHTRNARRSRRLSRQSVIFGVGSVLLLVTMLILQIASARTESQTVDEGAHLAAGYSYWKTGDFRLNPEHPPLVKLLASVPLLFLPIHIPLDHPTWQRRDQWGFAREFLYRNTIDADTILLLGRIPVMILGLVLTLSVGLWSRRHWGVTGGLLSMALIAFDPTVLAHSRYVTTDIGVTLFFFATVFCFARFLERPTATRWWIVAVLFALTQLTKFSATILWVILAVLWALRRLAHDQHRELSFARAVLFFGSLVVSTYVLAFVMYGFEIKPPLADPQFAAVYEAAEIWQPEVATAQPGLARTVLRITDPTSLLGARIRNAFGAVPLPAYTFFRGISHVVWHNYWGHSSYLLGDFRSTGWWYYFPVAFLVKTPLATLTFFALTLIFLLRRAVLRVAAVGVQRGRRVWDRLLHAYRLADFSYTVLIVPPLLYFLISSTSKINLGVRHLLPVYPFLFVLAGILTTVRFVRWQRVWQSLLALLVTMLLFSSLTTYPHYLSYFSELVGGSANGARYLTDSNLDWGQELKRLGRYLDERQIPFVYMVYFGQAPMETYLKDFRFLPTGKEPERIEQLDGWAAISVSALVNESGDYDWLRVRQPDATIGDAIYLYDLRKDRSPSEEIEN